MSDHAGRRSNAPCDRAICIDGIADLHREPIAASECVTQCLFGESLDVIDWSGDWARVRTCHDDYPGHIRTASIRPDHGAREPNGTVGVRATLIFARPDIKSPVLRRIPLGARLVVDGSDGADGIDGDEGNDGIGGTDRAGRTDRVVGDNRDVRNDEHDDFARIVVPVTSDDPGDFPREGHVWRKHIVPIGGFDDASAIDLALRHYAGAPYRWGGRTPDGADCSGLLQGTARMLGLALPRDSDQQEAALATVIPRADRAVSDVVFWPGHVALLIDRDTLFHATAHSLGTAVESLNAVIERAGEPSSFRRLPTAI